jgi:hypothetical protein
VDTTSERPTPVRLIVTTDWYVGGSVLADVPPGGEYETSTAFPHTIAIHTIKVFGFELSWISVEEHRLEPKILVNGDDCEYRFDPPLEVPAYKKILLHLRNRANCPHTPKIAVNAVAVKDLIDDSAIEPHEPRRASEFTAVAPPQEPTLTAADGETPPTRAEAVPSSVFTDVTLRGGAIVTKADNEGDAGASAVHREALRLRQSADILRYKLKVPSEITHRPLLTRTLFDGPGNMLDVRGCACGADVVSDETFAAHVGWPVGAIRALLGLAGIAYDLLEGHALTREDVLRSIAHCMEVRR